jgi:hypothetical protein
MKCGFVSMAPVTTSHALTGVLPSAELIAEVSLQKECSSDGTWPASAPSVKHLNDILEASVGGRIAVAAWKPRRLPDMETPWPRRLLMCRDRFASVDNRENAPVSSS